MTKALAIRESRAQRAPVVPRALLRKDKLLWREQASLYWQWIAMAGFALIMFLGLAAAADHSPGAWFWIALGSIGIIAMVLWLFFQHDERDWTIPQKRRAFFLDRLRKSAPHADDRKMRARDVDYTQYSVNVWRDGSNINVGLWKHKKYEGNYTPLGAFFGWRPWRYHEKSGAHGYSVKIGSWAQGHGTYVTITEPTLERVDDVVNQMGEVARDLEKNSYNEMLEKRRVDHIAYLHQPPPSGSRDRKVYRKAQERFERSL